MSVDLPWTRIASLAIRPVLFSGNQEGSLGGPTLQIPRLGDRFAADIETAQLQQNAEGRLLIATLTEATTGDAKIAIRQPNLPRLSIAGAPVIDGAGQAGASLNIRGAQPGAALFRGQYVGLIHGGVSYLYMLSGNVIVRADGKATLSLWPMLRFLSVDGETVDVTPSIEGQLVGFDKGAKWVRNRVDPLSFSIVERV
ncbi:hypothetical protein [Sphingomonas sp.]|uniref:hypothetical protein n=1 Tax=Sphingomonas sp. TaxID=28214 RepID=UPI003B009A77